MADMGVLARLTQQASDNIFREHNFRSSLFAQARQELQTDRQLRLQESNAIANRMNQAEQMAGQRRQNDIRNRQNAERLAQQKAYQDERLRQSGSGGGFGAIIPELPTSGQPSGQPMDGFATDPDNPAARGRGDSFIPPTSNQVPGSPQTQEDNEVLARIKQNAIDRIGTLEQQRELLKGREPKPPRYKNQAEQEKYNAAYPVYKDALANKEAEIVRAKTELEKLSVLKEHKPDTGPSGVEIERLNEWIGKVDVINAALQDPRSSTMVRLPDGDVTRKQAEALKAEAERNVSGLTSKLSPAEKAALGVPSERFGQLDMPTWENAPAPDALRQRAATGSIKATTALEFLR